MICVLALSRVRFLTAPGSITAASFSWCETDEQGRLARASLGADDPWTAHIPSELVEAEVGQLTEGPGMTAEDRDASSSALPCGPVTLAGQRRRWARPLHRRRRGDGARGAVAVVSEPGGAGACVRITLPGSRLPPKTAEDRLDRQWTNVHLTRS